MEESNPLELVSEITELNDIHEFMQDDDVDRAMDLVVKAYMSKGKIPPHQATHLVIELQGLSSKFAILSTYYSGIGKAGTNEAKKKNIYFTLKEQTARLSDALKYASKAGQA